MKSAIDTAKQNQETMINPGIPEELWAILDTRLWHSTSAAGLRGIVADGMINTASARYSNSFSLSKGGVSLFDFGPDSSDQDDFMLSNWWPWLGHQHEGRCAIWLEVDRFCSGRNLMNPCLVRETVRKEEFRGRYFVGVEACHLGVIPIAYVRSAVFIDKHDLSRFEYTVAPLSELNHQLMEYCKLLPEPPPESPLLKAIRLSSERRNDG